MKILLAQIKTWFLTLLNAISIKTLQFTKRVNVKIEKLLETKKDDSFESLTPTLDCDQNNTYRDALLWALKNDDIKNIAVTGAYGSGKSSVIKKFRKEHPEYKYAHVSLACFNNETPDIQLVEMSILQQLSYYVKYKSVPDSRITRIKKNSKLKISFWAFLCFTFLLSLFIIIFIHNPFRNEILEIFKKWKLLDICWHELKILTYIYAASFTLWLISKLIRNFSSLKIGKFTLQGNAIELAKTVEPSILNKHLDEILYYFEVNKFDVVIVEDLDRFTCNANNQNIFAKLREINQLINNSQQVQHKVVFLYAVKDDLFSNLHKDRTKFFDFVIPIVPVINVSNSGDLLLKRITKNENKISQEFENLILDVSLYIDDMRLVNNIFNEYAIYSKVLSNNPDKLRIFAMIVYKNLMPDDFALLHSNQGAVYKLFSNVKELTKKAIEEEELKLSTLKEKINLSEKSVLKDINELRMIYLFKIIELYPEGKDLIINDSAVSIVEAKEDQWFSQLISNNFKVRIYNPNTYRVTAVNEIDFSEIEKNVDTQSYVEREKIIKNKERKELISIKKEKLSIEERIKELEIGSIEKLNLASNDAYFKEIQSQPALIYMIRNGYINEDYHRFISFIYEGRLSLPDHEFLSTIKMGISKPFDYKLEKIENVYKQLKNVFDKDVILNITLFDYLLKTGNKYQVEIKRIFDQRGYNYIKYFDFVECYLKEGAYKKEFLEAVCSNWNDLWFIATHVVELPEEKLRFIAYNLIENINPDVLKLICEDGLFPSYIENLPELLDYSLKLNLNTKVTNIIKELDLKFNTLQKSENEELIDFIYKGKYYEINEYMIRYFVLHYSKNNINEEISTIYPSYTNIFNMEDDSLFRHICNNLSLYIKEVYLKQCNWIEDEDHIYYFLGSESILEIDEKIAIVDKMLNVISDLSEIDGIELKEKVIEKNKCAPTWNNIFNYYSEKLKFDNILLKFLIIEENYLPLSKIRCNYGEKYDKKFVQEFSLALLHENNLSFDSYSYLIKALIFRYREFDFQPLSENKIVQLIKNEIIKPSENTFIGLIPFQKCFIELATRDKRSFLRNYSSYKIDSEGQKILLSSSKFTEEQKSRIIKKIDIKALNNIPLGNIIIKVVYNENIELDLKELNQLLKYSDKNEYRILLVTSYLQSNNNSSDEISSLMQSLGGKYYELSKLRCKPTFNNIDYNLRLLETLKKVKYIRRFEKEKNQIRSINRYV